MPQEFTPLINGSQYSGASVRVNILGVSISGLKAIRYKEMQEKTNVFGAGRLVNSRSFGKETAEGSVTLLMNDLVALQKAAPEGKIYKIAAFDIIVSWIEGTSVVVHTLQNCEFMEVEINGKTDDKEIAIELPLIMTGVKWV